MDNKHILVVEDEVDLREAVMEALSDAGYKVSGAENGQVGLSLALAEHPDLILLDLMMPVMDGHAVLQHLREDPWGKSAHVVVLSAMDDVSNVALAHNGRPLDYFIKAHMSLEELVKQVKILVHTIQ
jgi:DNA-binding response OmpR family regulator